MEQVSYQESHPEQLVALLEQGLLDCEICAALKISRDTFYRWMKEYPDFKEAFNIGIPRCEAIYVARARECWQKGDEKGFKYFIALMNNKFGWGKEETAAKQITNNQINIQSVQMINTREQFLELVDQTKAQALELKTLGILDVELLPNEPGQS